MNIFQLKLLAAFLMVLDHIHIFFPETPIFFDYIGSLAIPLFVFALVEGIKHTRDLKRYFLRLYVFSIFMQVNANLMDFEVGNSIRIFVILLILIVLLERYQSKQPLKNKGLWLFVAYQALAVVLNIVALNLTELDDALLLLINTVFATAFLADGGYFFVLIGLIFYYAYHDFKKLAFLFTGFVSVNMIFFNTPLLRIIFNGLSGINGILADIFYGLFEVVIGWDILFYNTSPLSNIMWMGVFSLFVLYFYDGSFFKSNLFQKYFFYIFYPTHLWVLYFLANQVS